MKFCVSGLANLSAYKIKPQMLVVAVVELDVVCTSMLRDFDFRYKNSVAVRKKEVARLVSGSPRCYYELKMMVILGP